MVNEPGAGPGFFSGSARAAEPGSAQSASGTRSANLLRESDLTWMLMAAELPTRAACRGAAISNSRTHGPDAQWPGGFPRPSGVEELDGAPAASSAVIAGHGGAVIADQDCTT